MRLEKLHAMAFQIMRKREQNARDAQARDVELEKELAEVLRQIAEIEKDEDRSIKR